MTKALPVLAALLAVICASAAEFKHAVASVEVAGTWEKDGDSSEDTLILNSKPEGRQIVVATLRLKKAPMDMDQLVEITAQLFQKRMAAFMELSKGTALLDEPATKAEETAVVCWCRAYAPKDKTRMLLRIEASATTRLIRSTSIYDYTGRSEEDFKAWSEEMMTGVK